MWECGKECEVYSRVVGYYQPIHRWNEGKKEKFGDRLECSEVKTLKHDFRKTGGAVEK